MTENEFTYWAFLSYSQQDNCEQRPETQEANRLCWGDWLHDALKTFPIPTDFAGQPNARGEIIPERIDPIFRDAQDPSAEASLDETTRRALEQSRCLIVICSPRSAGNPRVNEAVRYFKQLGRGNRILPIVIAGTPNAAAGDKPGTSPDDECFVPALRHPVLPDGTLDTSRRDRGPIFADARHGDEKQEIQTEDQQPASTELQIAKIQLIAGLLGVGFNGLWMREHKRRFTEMKRPPRESAPQPPEPQSPSPDVQNQIQAAQNQARDAQRQLQEFQAKVRETESQLEAARNQVRDAESKVLEAQNQAHEIRNQLEEARNQVREAQNKTLEMQNLPPDVKSQIQEAQSHALAAQNQARDAQGQIEEARNQALAAQAKMLAAEQQAHEARSRVQELENQDRQSQSQLEEVLRQVGETKSKLIETQRQAQAAQTEAEQTRNQACTSQNQLQAIQDQTRDAQSQIQEARNQAREAQNQVQGQVLEIENKSRQAKRLTKVLALIAVLTLMAAGIATIIAWRQRKIAKQAVAKATAVEAGKFDLTQAGLATNQVRQTLQTFGGTEQHENRLLSLDNLAVRIPTEEIPDALQASSAILNDRQRSHFQKHLLVRLGAVNPLSAMTNAAAITEQIVTDDGTNASPSYFQFAVLDNWMQTNLPGTMEWVRQLPAADSRPRILAKIVPNLVADNPTNALAWLNKLQPAPDEQVYAAFFRSWAAHDPVPAIQQLPQAPVHDTENNILTTLITDWVKRAPDAALDWLTSQPDSESHQQLLKTGIEEVAKTNFQKALTAAESLPESLWRNAMIVGLFNDWAANDLEAATIACHKLPKGTVKEKAWECVVNRRIESDPVSAIEDVTHLAPGDYRQKAIDTLSQRWADTDAPATLAWAQCLPIEPEQNSAIKAATVSWAQKDPESAMRFAEFNSELSTNVLADIANAWAKLDPKGLAAYALALPAGDAQTQCLTVAGRQLAVHDLPATVKLLQPLSDATLRHSILETAGSNCDLQQVNQTANYVAAMPTGDDQTAVIKGLLSTWAPAAPEMALNWLLSFPQTNAQPKQVESVIKNWSEHEPALAADWLARLPAETATEGMTRAFLEGTVETRPIFAAQWTESVTNETQRQQFQLQVARQWKHSDSTDAFKWLQQLELTNETKQSLSPSLPEAKVILNTNTDTNTNIVEGPAHSPAAAKPPTEDTNAPTQIETRQ